MMSFFLPGEIFEEVGSYLPREDRVILRVACRTMLAPTELRELSPDRLDSCAEDDLEALFQHVENVHLLTIPQLRALAKRHHRPCHHYLRRAIKYMCTRPARNGLPSSHTMRIMWGVMEDASHQTMKLLDSDPDTTTSYHAARRGDLDTVIYCDLVARRRRNPFFVNSVMEGGIEGGQLNVLSWCLTTHACPESIITLLTSCRWGIVSALMQFISVDILNDAIALMVNVNDRARHAYVSAACTAIEWAIMGDRPVDIPLVIFMVRRGGNWEVIRCLERCLPSR